MNMYVIFVQVKSCDDLQV